MTQYTVIFDACVMYPAPLRSYLMYLANTGLFRARWSEQIHDEWIRNLLANRPDLKPESLQRTRELMNRHVPDCLVTGYESLVDGINLPDADDRHVVAAAIKGQAESIITFNLKDFPAESLGSLEITAVHPDEFLVDMYELDQSACLKAAQQHRRGLKNPQLDAEQYLSCLLKQQLPNFVSKLRPMALFL